jgi:RimJ/RimL family protein N-acetyltransferase
VPLQIVDVKKCPLRDEEVWMLAEIETHPKVLEWNSDIHTKNRNRMYCSFKTFLEKLPSNNDQIFLVGKLNGRVVCFLAIHRKSKRLKNVGIVGISVHPDYWSKGFGTKLLKAGAEHARKEEFLRFEAKTLIKNKAMMRIAEKVGFKHEGMRRMRMKVGEKYEDEALLGMILKRERRATS